ncbi:Ran-specific GTPase-activating protein 30, partial [Coemansia sp. RSA 530]
MYSLFVGSVRPKSKMDFTWKEEFARCQVALWRVCTPSDSDAMISEFSYELCVVEDLNDGRYHDDTTGKVGANNERAWIADMAKHVDMRPGRVVRIPLDIIGGLHYTSAGSLLNIEDSNAPALVISFEDRKSGDITAVGSGLNISSVLPSLETTRTTWYALEVVTDDVDEPDMSSASSESGEDSSASSESGEDSSASSESDEDGVGDGARSGNALGVCDMESMGSGSKATTDSETSESEDAVSEHDSSSGSEYSESEDSASEQDASSGSEPESNNSESEHSAKSSPKNNAKAHIHTPDDIDKLADSIASLCTIDPSPVERTPLSKAQTLPSTFAEAAEYFRPVEFLANEWRMCTLSLLEYMVRLASIEISEQTSHLN